MSAWLDSQKLERIIRQIIEECDELKICVCSHCKDRRPVLISWIGESEKQKEHLRTVIRFFDAVLRLLCGTDIEIICYEIGSTPELERAIGISYTHSS